MAEANRVATVTVDWTDLVLGRANAPPENVAPEKLAEIVELVIQKMMSLMGHLPGFVPVGEIPANTYHPWRIEGSVALPNLVPTIKCLNLGDHETIEHKQGSDIAEEQITAILLTEEGHLLQWQYTRRGPTVIPGTIRPLADEELVNLLERQPSWVNRIFLRKISRVCLESIAQREQHLRMTEGLRALVVQLADAMAEDMRNY